MHTIYFMLLADVEPFFMEMLLIKMPMQNNSTNRYGNLNGTRGYFGGKSYNHPRPCEAETIKESTKMKSES